jgi:hypothetical protein
MNEKIKQSRSKATLSAIKIALQAPKNIQASDITRANLTQQRFHIESTYALISVKRRNRNVQMSL